MAQEAATSRRTGLWIAAGVVVVLLLLGIAALKLYFTPERLRAMLTPRLEKELNRPVKLDRVGLNLLGGIEASVEGLTVSDRPGFGTEPFLAADRAGFSLAFWPLFKGETKLGEVAIEKPRISVVINEEGEANYADLVEEEKEPSAAGLAVNRVVISDGQVRYEDRQAGSSTLVEGIDYRVQPSLEEEGLVFTGELSVANTTMVSGENDTLRTGAFRVTHDVRLAPGGEEVAVRSLRAEVGPLALNVTGTVRNLSKRPELQLAVENPEVEMDRVAAYLAEAGVMEPGAEIRGNARLSGRVEGVWAPEGDPPVYPSVHGKASLKNLSIDSPGLPVENGVAEVEIADGRVRLTGGRADVGNGTVQVRGELDARKMEGPYPAQAQVELENLDLGVLAGPFLLEDETVSGRVSGSLQVRATLDSQLELVRRHTGNRLVQPAVSGNVSIEEVRYTSPELLVPVENAVAAFSLKEDVVRISRLNGQAGRSDFSVGGRVEGALAWALAPENEKPPRPFLAVNITAQVLDMDEMFPVEESGQAALPEPGWGLVSPAYGAAEATDETSPALWLVRIADAQGELQVGELKSDGVQYRDFRADARARDGVLRLDNVRAGLYGGRMKGQFEVDARPTDGTVPVRASVAVDSVEAQGLLQAFLEWQLPLQGRMGVSFTMEGKMDSTLELVEKEIDAEGVAGVEEGKLVNWNVLQKLGERVGQLGFLDFNEVPIRSLVAPFRVEDSRFFFDNLKVTAAGLACRLSGSAGLDKSLDYTLNVDVPASRLNVGGLNLGSALGSMLGGGANTTIPLRIHIGGTAEDPQVKADLQTGGKAQVKEKEADLREKAKQKGKDLIKKLF